MQYRRVGTTDIMVSHVGFGCWTMGGPAFSPTDGNPIGWADVDEGDVLAGVKVGLNAGVNHWDNADIYGNGRAERMLGSCLRKVGVKRDTQTIATKVGHMKGTAPHAYDPAHIRAQCEQSLKNLGVDTIDLYYLHHGSYVGTGYNGEERDYLHEAAATMHALKKEGKIRAIGQSAYGDADFVRAVPVLKPDVLQARANLRAANFITPGSAVQHLMETHGCSFVAFGPLDQGILLDKFDPANPPKFDEGDSRGNRRDMTAESLLRVREKLTKLAAHFGFANATGDARIAAFSSVASRWVLAHPHVSSVIPGFRNARQATCNVAAGSAEPMSPTDVAFVRALFAE